MKVLNINSYYYSSTVHYELQAKLRKTKIKPLTYIPLAQGYQPRDQRDFELNSQIVNSFPYQQYHRYIFHLKHLRIWHDLRQRFDYSEFSLVHAASLFSNGYLALKLKEKYQLPYIVVVRDTDINVFFKRLHYLRFLGHKILANADKIIFLSETYRATLLDKYVPTKLKAEIFNKSVIIPNGINEFWLSHLGQPKNMENKRVIKLIHVGTIDQRKNLLATVAAIDILIKEGYQVSYTVVGKVKDKAIYERIKKLPYSKIIPPVSFEDLLKLYRVSDILVVPSKTETFGLVYVEAMSQGLPLIYTKGQGFDGQFSDGQVGYAVAADNVAEIAEKIKMIILNYETISSNCVLSSTKFDWQKITKQYLAMYEEFD